MTLEKVYVLYLNNNSSAEKAVVMENMQDFKLN